jgi:thymidylate kinase
MYKIALSGTHGSGKTTLVNFVTGKLKSYAINIGCMAETARTSPFIINGTKSIDTQLHIFFKHIEQEILEKLSKYDIFLTDRTPIDMLAYTELFYPKEEDTIQMMHNLCQWYMKSYKCIFRTTFMYNLDNDHDNFRPKENSLQKKADKKIKELLDIYYPHYIELPDTSVEDISEYMISKLNMQRIITLPNTCNCCTTHP